MGDLSDEIRRLRAAKQLSVRQLAAILKKTPGYVSRIEARGEVPSDALILEIAGALGADPEHLLRLAKTDELREIDASIDSRHEAAIQLYRKSSNASSN